MRIYRASGDIPIFYKGTCWMENISDAIAYLDNPGFGGANLYEGTLPKGMILDVIPGQSGYPEVPRDLLEFYARNVLKWVPYDEADDHTMYTHQMVSEDDFEDFITNPGWVVEGRTGRKYPYSLWEGEPKVVDWLKDQGYVAIRYEDDYPERAVAYFIVHGVVGNVQRIGGKELLKEHPDYIHTKDHLRGGGIGKGWHDDRYRHSLAARGVRTR